MSFHEKNAWACLVSVLIVYIPYFLYVSQEPVASIILFVVAVIFLAVLLTLFHALNAVFSSRIRRTGDTPKRDERDRYFELKAARLSGTVLGFCVIVWCINAMMGIPLKGLRNAFLEGAEDSPVDISDFSIPAMEAIWWVQLLFACFVFANVVYYASMIFSYRRHS